MKTFTVCMFVDLDIEEDYEDIEGFMKSTLKRSFLGEDVKIKFNRNVPPWDLEGRPCDFYVIDYGGISAAGAYDTALSIVSSVIKPIKERPNTLFIIWTFYTVRLYEEAIEDDSPELLDHPNVLLHKDSGAEDLIETILQWARDKE